MLGNERPKTLDLGVRDLFFIVERTSQVNSFLAILMSFIHLSSVHIWGGKNRFPSNSSTWLAFQMRTVCKFSTCSKRKAQSKLSFRVEEDVFANIFNIAQFRERFSKLFQNFVPEVRCVLVVFRS